MSLIQKTGSYLLVLLLAIDALAQAQRQIPLEETNAGYGFYEYLPDGYGDTTDKFPLIIYLHGRGETGNGGSELIKVKENGPHRLIEEGRAFPAVILSPQSPDDWEIDRLDTFVDWVFSNYRVDTARFYLTGISMGGAGTWLYAVAYPDKPDAIVPISGDAHAKNPQNLIGIPVWAFHNEGDHVVEVELTYEWIESIREAGGDPKMTIYDQSGHDAWTQTYNDDNMWEWMFSQPVPPPLSTEEPFHRTVYPNPFRDVLHFTSLHKPTLAVLYDMYGKRVVEWTTFEQKETSYAVRMNTHLQSGVYMLKISSPEGTFRYRILKE